MIFQLYDCDIGIVLGGVTYELPHVNSITIEDPTLVHLTRGANASNNLGLVYTEGMKSPKTINASVMDMPIELLTALKNAYTKRTRFDFFCIKRDDGSSKMMKNCIFSQVPQQLTLDDSEESLNVILIFETFDVSETHKS